MADDETTEDVEKTAETAPLEQPAKPKLKGKKAIKEALNKADSSGKAAKMRKLRKRNNLRAEAYHSAKSVFAIPMKVKIMMGLIIVAVSLIMVLQYRDERERRALVSNVYMAAKKGDFPAVRKFLDTHPEFADVPDAENNTLMHYGAMSGNADICRAVLELNGSMARINDFRRMPIHYAAENGSVDVVRMLVNRDTYVTLSDKDGMQPIHLAARNGNPEIIQMLLNSRAKVDSPSSFLMTPLHHAVQAGTVEGVKALLEFKPKLNVLNSHGYTPLHIAVICGHYDVAKLLIAAGEDPTYASSGTDSALDLAINKKDDKMIAILRTPQADMTEQPESPAPAEEAQ